jgi:Flp pilus assembly protein TadB
MTSHDQNEREQELKNREQALQDRELAIRLKELESEIHARSQTHETSVSADYSTRPDSNSLRHRFKTFLRWSKVIGFTILGLTIAFVGVFVGVWLVYIALLGGVGIISYQLFFGKNRSNRP